MARSDCTFVQAIRYVRLMDKLISSRIIGLHVLKLTEAFEFSLFYQTYKSFPLFSAPSPATSMLVNLFHLDQHTALLVFSGCATCGYRRVVDVFTLPQPADFLEPYRKLMKL